jgi:hypothetical protein
MLDEPTDEEMRAVVAESMVNNAENKRLLAMVCEGRAHEISTLERWAGMCERGEGDELAREIRAPCWPPLQRRLDHRHRHRLWGAWPSTPQGLPDQMRRPEVPHGRTTLKVLEHHVPDLRGTGSTWNAVPPHRRPGHGAGVHHPGDVGEVEGRHFLPGAEQLLPGEQVPGR